jgi:hypothetical protein
MDYKKSNINTDREKGKGAKSSHIASDASFAHRNVGRGDLVGEGADIPGTECCIPKLTVHTTLFGRTKARYARFGGFSPKLHTVKCKP